ncbi:MAG: hypothetical protein IPO77_22695 [Acidobacteria bacterium]|nr:hypothetical protein [Acidobacteriota bacterium]
MIINESFRVSSQPSGARAPNPPPTQSAAMAAAGRHQGACRLMRIGGDEMRQSRLDYLLGGRWGSCPKLLVMLPASIWAKAPRSMSSR